MNAMLIAFRKGHKPITITGWRAWVALVLMKFCHRLTDDSLTYRFVSYDIGASENIKITITRKDISITRKDAET